MASWFYHDGTKQIGPLAEAQLLEHMKSGVVLANALIWKEGTAAWIAAAASEMGLLLNQALPAPAQPQDTLAGLCPHCRSAFTAPREFAGKSAKCNQCGQTFTLAPPSRVPAQHAEGAEAPPVLPPIRVSVPLLAEPPGAGSIVADSRYRGYHGWLAFFVAVHLFFFPMAGGILWMFGDSALNGLSVVPLRGILALAIKADHEQDREGNPMYSRLLTMTVLEVIGSFALIGLGMYVGLRLRKLRPGTVRLAQGYLIAALVYALVRMGFPFMCGDIPERLGSALLRAEGEGLLCTMIAVGIWFPYFKLSKRVKASFPKG